MGQSGDVAESKCGILYQALKSEMVLGAEKGADTRGSFI